MGLQAEKQAQIYTYKDYALWPDEERWELIDGVAYNMSPAPSRFHQKISGALFSKIYQYLEGKSCEVYHAPFDVRLPKGQESEEEILTVVQPEIYSEDNAVESKVLEGFSVDLRTIFQ